MSADMVFLIPGFLGFERAGNFGNFADRVCSALRAPLEAKLGTAVTVVPLASLPTTDFGERQSALLELLARHVAGNSGNRRIHLVGHSVGGVDAHLLACAEPVSGGSWVSLDPYHLRSKLRSVLTLGAPHAGTCIAEAPGAGPMSLASLREDPNALRASADLLNKLLRSAVRDVRAAPGSQGLLREYRKVKHFMAELLHWQNFMPLLRTDAMEALYARMVPLPEVVRRSFVTVAGAPRDPAHAVSRADAFFEELSRRASGSGNGFTRHSPCVRDAQVTLRAALDDAARVIVAPSTRAPAHIDAHSNDGMVNAARQLMTPDSAEELGAVVIADHFDVLGYYDRGLSTQGRETDEVVVSGLLHSGSAFRDAEFYALYRRMADIIAQQCIDPQVAKPPVLEPPPTKRVGRRAPSRRPTA